jgi:hypothetical protein
VMILVLICQLMCATIPGAHIRCIHSILSFNWSVTVRVASAPSAGYDDVRLLGSLKVLCSADTGHGSMIGASEALMFFFWIKVCALTVAQN